MGIDTYNGGGVLAMAGKKCVAIATDHRFGTQYNTISRNCLKVHPISSKVMVGLAGLETDNQTVLAKIKFRMKMFKLREEREMPAEAVGSMISNVWHTVPSPHSPFPPAHSPLSLPPHS